MFGRNKNSPSITITTVTGSKYEIDSDRNLIRRLTDENHCVENHFKTGQWRKYSSMSDIRVGRGLVIGWNKPFLIRRAEMTLTSPINSIDWGGIIIQEV